MENRDNYWNRIAKRSLSRRRVVGLAASGVVGLALAACGGDDDDDDGNSGGQPTSSTGNGSTGDSPVRGKTLNVGTTLEAGTLDPHLGTSGGDSLYLATMFNPLIAAKNGKATPEISLAHKWEIADPTTIVFSLREGVKFHDGTDFNAQAAKVNFERIKNPDNKATGASSISMVDSIDATDATTLKFNLREPNAALFSSISGQRQAMISPAALEKYGSDVKSHPVGTGPFVFESWVPGSSAKVKRNPNYWEKNAAGELLPYLDEIVIENIPDQTVLFANFQTGDIHLAELGARGVGDKDAASAESNPNISVVWGPEGLNQPTLLAFNMNLAPMDNVNLRKAAAFAIDPTMVVKSVLFGNGKPADGGLIQPGTWAWSPVEGRPSYDVKKAKEFLAAGGAPDGFKLEVIAAGVPNIVQTTEIYQQQWKQVGIDAQITTQDTSTATSSFFSSGLFPVYSTWWGSTTPEPNGTAVAVYAKDAFYNAMKRAIDPRIDDLILKARQTYDLEERKSLYAEIDQIILVEQCCFIPMIYSKPGWVTTKKLGGQNFVDFGYYRLQEVFLS